MKIDPRIVEDGLKSNSGQNVYNRMLKTQIMGQIQAQNQYLARIDTSQVAATNVRHSMQELLVGRITDEDA